MSKNDRITGCDCVPATPRFWNKCLNVIQNLPPALIIYIPTGKMGYIIK